MANMNAMYWGLAIVVVAVLVYLGASEMRRMSAYTAAKRAAPTRAARAATNGAAAAASGSAPASAPPPPRRELSGIAITDAFQEFDVDRSMTRVVPESDYVVPESMFLQEFVDGDKSAFRPVDKEAALRSANTRPSQHMQNDRDNGVKSRTVGLYGMAFAGRGPIERPVEGSSACISFNDTDTRQTRINDATHCFATESCPWQQ